MMEPSIHIYVNGRSKRLPIGKDSVTYVEACILAFGFVPDEKNVLLTVTYAKGIYGASGSLLVNNEAVQVCDGMVFNVTSTNKA